MHWETTLGNHLEEAYTHACIPAFTISMEAHSVSVIWSVACNGEYKQIKARMIQDGRQHAAAARARRKRGGRTQERARRRTQEGTRKGHGLGKATNQILTNASQSENIFGLHTDLRNQRYRPFLRLVFYEALTFSLCVDFYILRVNGFTQAPC